MRTFHVGRKLTDKLSEVAELRAQLEFGAVQEDVQDCLHSARSRSPGRNVGGRQIVGQTSSDTWSKVLPTFGTI